MDARVNLIYDLMRSIERSHKSIIRDCSSGPMIHDTVRKITPDMRAQSLLALVADFSSLENFKRWAEQKGKPAMESFDFPKSVTKKYYESMQAVSNTEEEVFNEASKLILTV